MRGKRVVGKSFELKRIFTYFNFNFVTSSDSFEVIGIEVIGTGIVQRFGPDILSD